MLKNLLILILVALALTTVLTPPVASGIASLFPGAGLPFSRIFDRVALVMFAVMVVVQRKHFPLYLIAEQVKQRTLRFHASAMSFGISLTSLTGLGCLPLVVATSPLMWSDKTAAASGLKYLYFLPVAIVAAGVEEAFFRVILYQGLSRKAKKWLAALSSSGLYACVHFLSPVKQFPYEGFVPTAGFSYLSKVFSQLASPATLLAMVGLLLIGLLLCWTIEKTGSFALCVGLHAGWFAVAKVAIYATSTKAAIESGLLLDKRIVFLSHPAFWSSVLVVAGVLTLTLKWWRLQQER